MVSVDVKHHVYLREAYTVASELHIQMRTRSGSVGVGSEVLTGSLTLSRRAGCAAIKKPYTVKYARSVGWLC